MKIKNYNLDDVTKIVIYGNGKKLYEIDSNSFKPCKIIANSKGEDKIEEFSYWYKISDIKFNGEITNARKENLNRSDNYFLSYKREYWQNKGIALYIHESEISVKSLGNILAMETDEEKNYLAAFSFLPLAMKQTAQPAAARRTAIPAITTTRVQSPLSPSFTA